DGDGVGRFELAGRFALLAPIEQVFAVGRDLDAAGVTVAAGDVDGVALGREGDVGGAVEGLGVGAGLALDAEGEEQLVQRRKFHDLVVAAYGGPKVAPMIE